MLFPTFLLCYLHMYVINDNEPILGTRKKHTNKKEPQYNKKTSVVLRFFIILTTIVYKIKENLPFVAPF